MGAHAKVRTWTPTRSSALASALPRLSRVRMPKRSMPRMGKSFSGRIHVVPGNGSQKRSFMSSPGRCKRRTRPVRSA
uniref:Uncharacterized protein n=1 Tax=Oryza meridionalis TaxID=40149 RepID=A0A0E0DEX5_9ORYZ